MASAGYQAYGNLDKKIDDMEKNFRTDIRMYRQEIRESFRELERCISAIQQAVESITKELIPEAASTKTS
ncbi:hypothetical protein TWF481_009468 [Arthrobotrys musiformis]|uniref:Uncharacterized protein n=1 Tax=Arthrobotrys musiformis TaxID=47236 RepID=A0AAV9W4T2_9PEZI